MLRNIMLMIVAMAASCVSTFAGEDSNAVRVFKPDGSSEVFLLNLKPAITFTEKDLLFTVGDITLSYPLSACVKFTFENCSGQAEELEDNGLRMPVIFLTKNGIRAINLTPESTVCVYDIQGRLLCTSRADSCGTLEVSDLNAIGTYIVKTDCSTFKIIRR